MELLDIVNTHDEVVEIRESDEIYTTWGPEALQEVGKTIRSVYLIIRRSDGTIFTPRRAKHKSKFPGGLDFSVCGHVQSWESYDAAIARETLEELGIDISNHTLNILGKLSPFDYPELHSMSMGYELLLDETPPIDPKEWGEYYYLTPEELITKLSLPEESHTKKDIIWIVRHFYTK